MAEIRINATGGLKLYDADNSHYAQIVAGTITSNVDAITLGHDTVTIADNLSLGSDSAVIKFGADSEITLTHSADAGLLLKHTATADDKPVSLTLQTGETDIAANDVIGKIDFQAPDEGTGTDAILVAAGIEAVSEGDFSSSNNATKLSFKTAASEAAAEKASLSSTGVFTATSFTGSGAGLTAGTTPVTTLDIDGATDIGAAIVDADLFIIDDGAGGTNRKTTASRIKTYVAGMDGTPAWYATDGSGQGSISASTWTTRVYGTEVYDTDSAYNTTSATFTVPSNEGGKYLVMGSNTYDTAGSGRLLIAIYVGSTAKILKNYAYDDPVTVLGSTQQCIGVLNLSASDEVTIRIWQDKGTASSPASQDNENWFAGWKLS